MDADGQLHAGSEVITSGEDLDGELWRWLS